ncbi:restriction endonuclease subunit S [Pseudoalteromonas distincta]|uniref:restriction endonuclease subunit S n=1 Tax=Pseudoalteromonas distincta TaxID=77608 RepID=UPI00165F8693|nr:restriction endonuclease subunit S [Pseudoalteromonas distincta]MBD0410932.1 restriction endonuclease subunit S [Pseudoalteromonas distincta]
MTSNYKKIGDYIRLVDVRNKDLTVETLLGLSITKEFIPSVANTVGTNMANYKIIKKGQFACSLMQVRRDKRIPVALQSDFDEAIISQAYPVFEVVDSESLEPEYLMMWMSRSEFDRHACFLAVGGVRGSLEWDDFCDMELPIPSIEKQREIVREYKVVSDRIALNEQLTQKLEKSAQAIYKQWFVDFEFPISREYAESIGKPELEGRPYKSSGGEVEYSERLEKEIPINWRTISLGDIAQEKKESFKLRSGFQPTNYIGLEHMPKKSISLSCWEEISSIGSNKSKFFENDILFGKLRPYFHKVGVAFVDGICSTDIIVCQSKANNNFGLLLSLMSSVAFVDYSNSGWSGTKMPRTSWDFMTRFELAIPKDNNLTTLFNSLVISLVKYLKQLALENRQLTDFAEIIKLKMSKV